MKSILSALTDIDIVSDNDEDLVDLTVVPRRSFHAKESIAERARAQTYELDRCVKEAQERMVTVHEAQKAEAQKRLDTLLGKQQAAESDWQICWRSSSPQRK